MPLRHCELCGTACEEAKLLMHSEDAFICCVCSEDAQLCELCELRPVDFGPPTESSGYGIIRKIK
jgi:hypothetical protein